MDTALTILPSAMPSLSLEQARDRYQLMNSFVQGILRENIDYGVIPGTGSKATLLKAGAEKLTTFFGLRPTFLTVKVIEDWTGKDHDGEPFFYYWFRCQLLKGSEVVAEGDGSCNSRETKYRYRKSERVCPACGTAAIIKGRAEYGGGWLCFAKKGGCGAKFRDGDQDIEGQQTGRIINPDVADQVNTMQKIAQKRSLIAATLIGVNASDYFTQDLDDLPLAGDFIEGSVRILDHEDQAPSTQAPAPQQTQAPRAAATRPQTQTEKRKVAPQEQTESRKLAVVQGTGAFIRMSDEFAAAFPAYQNKDGSTDRNHILATIAKLNFDVVNPENEGAVFKRLAEHATDKQLAQS